VYVCVGHQDVPCNNGRTDRDAVCGLVYVCSHGKEQLLGLSGPVKSIGSLCCKRDHSVLNDGTTCNAGWFYSQCTFNRDCCIFRVIFTSAL